MWGTPLTKMKHSIWNTISRPLNIVNGPLRPAWTVRPCSLESHLKISGTSYRPLSPIFTLTTIDWPLSRDLTNRSACLTLSMEAPLTYVMELRQIAKNLGRDHVNEISLFGFIQSADALRRDWDQRFSRVPGVRPCARMKAADISYRAASAQLRKMG